MSKVFDLFSCLAKCQRNEIIRLFRKEGISILLLTLLNPHNEKQYVDFIRFLSEQSDDMQEHIIEVLDVKNYVNL